MWEQCAFFSFWKKGENWSGFWNSCHEKQTCFRLALRFFPRSVALFRTLTCSPRFIVPCVLRSWHKYLVVFHTRCKHLITCHYVTAVDELFTEEKERSPVRFVERSRTQKGLWNAIWYPTESASCAINVEKAFITLSLYTTVPLTDLSISEKKTHYIKIWMGWSAKSFPYSVFYLFGQPYNK